LARDHNSETSAAIKERMIVTIAEHRYPIRSARSTNPSNRIVGTHRERSPAGEVASAGAMKPSNPQPS
jgi:hypothetical protein